MLSFRSKKAKKAIQGLLYAFIVGLSVTLGWGTAHSINPTNIYDNTKSVDKADGNYKVGQDLYLQHCASCHIPIPPAVLPSATWKTILENPLNHYGSKVDSLNRLNQVLIWQYLQNYSRPLLQGEQEPKFIAQSRLFFALHPDTKFNDTVTHRSCIQCHIQAQNFVYSSTINND